jgi:hypothetical protein
MQELPLIFKNIYKFIKYLDRLTPAYVLENEAIYYELARSKGWDIEPLEKYLDRLSRLQREGKKRADRLIEGITRIVEEKDSITKPSEKVELIKSAIDKSNELKPCTWQDYMDDIIIYGPDEEYKEIKGD